MKWSPFPTRSRWIPACVCVVLAGCAGEHPLQPVSGRVTLDGNALPGAQVMFEPDTGDLNAGPGSYGTTDAEGRFTLETVDGRAGAVAGPHRISISTYEVQRGPDDEIIVVSGERVPPRYQVGDVTFTVPQGGTSSADFLLISE